MSTQSPQPKQILAWRHEDRQHLSITARKYQGCTTLNFSTANLGNVGENFEHFKYKLSLQWRPKWFHIREQTFCILTIGLLDKVDHSQLIFLAKLHIGPTLLEFRLNYMLHVFVIKQ